MSMYVQGVRMVAAVHEAITGTSTGAAATSVFRCANRTCARFLGTVRAGVLFEPNGDRSHLPCVRVCRNCKRRNIKLA